MAEGDSEGEPVLVEVAEVGVVTLARACRGVAKVNGEGVAPLLMKGLAPGNSARLAWRSPSRSRNRVGGTVWRSPRRARKRSGR